MFRSVCGLLQKIRTVELDGKVIKLQIVSAGDAVYELTIKGFLAERTHLKSMLRLACADAVGYSWSGAFQNHHKQLLSWCSWNHCRWPRLCFC